MENITKTFYMGQNKYEALKGVDVHIKEGETVAIVGPSGSGKSSTMNIIGLLDHPTTGHYYLNNKEVVDYTPNELAYLRNITIGFIFQQFFLLPKMNAVQNVGLPLYYRNVDRKTAREKSMAILEEVGMAQYATHKPSEMSGGQQQRVAIARALVGEPKIILADEPTGALDSKTSQSVLDLLLRQSKNSNATLVIITHDTEVAEQCSRVIQVYDGRIKE
jgi:putative ABC transport system ATP-binding protein